MILQHQCQLADCMLHDRMNVFTPMSLQWQRLHEGTPAFIWCRPLPMGAHWGADLQGFQQMLSEGTLKAFWRGNGEPSSASQ